MRIITAFLLVFGTASVAAQEEAEQAPPPPTMPESIEDVPIEPEELEPQVTITEEKGQIIEEYRAGGQLYMIKITPKNGYPYYLIDNDGDGRLETRQTGLEDPVIPQWVIFSW